MIIDQDEINALLAAAQNDPKGSAGGGSSPEPSRSVNAMLAIDPSEAARIMRIRVPVIVRLADRQIPVSQVMKFAPGWIIEFDRPGSAELELMINNTVVGTGAAVKVGENFGIRVSRIGDVRKRIESMGAT